jgi:ATP-dependent HslUV protease subunit HslV
MTCIAYKDGVMAADTMSVMDEHVKLLNEIKIAKHKGYLFAIAGDNCLSMKDFKAWWFPDLKKPIRKPVGGSFKFDALVVTPEGEMQMWDHRGRYEVMALPFYAIGSGKEYAIGAMQMGATAQQAVETAIIWCPTVGGKVITRKL